MKLYVGGAHQGKAAYVKEQTGLSPRLCTPEEALSAPAVDQFHRICRTLLEREEIWDHMWTVCWPRIRTPSSCAMRSA